jgi:RND family efflux transporter MFP subunit
MPVFALTGLLAATLVTGISGCKKDAPAAVAMQAMPVMVQPTALTGVPSLSTYVATIKSRRSTTLQPQVPGNLTRIMVKSGDVVKAGQVLMQIDPLKQVATVESQQATEQQQKAVYQYNESDLARQSQLYKAGIISKQAYDQATQSFQNSKAALDAAKAQTRTQREELAYYQIRAPFAGIVGDIPVHVGDYVSTATSLTTVDENKDLEAYIYLPSERAGDVRKGLAVDLLDVSGNVLAQTSLDFVSPEVDNDLQGILVKAPLAKAAAQLRSGQIVNARVTWSSSQLPTVPILVVSRIGDQSFVYIAAAKGSGFIAHQISVKLGEPVGNVYPVLGGLNPGDRVILSGVQFLQEGMPVIPMTPPSGAPATPAGN